MILQWLANPIFRHHEGLLVDKCKDDRDYGEKLLQKLDELIKEIKNQDYGCPCAQNSLRLFSGN